MGDEIIARCGCGRTFTMEEWAALEEVGIQQVEEDREVCTCGYAERKAAFEKTQSDMAVAKVFHRPSCPGAPYALEMRNCSCRSTICIDSPPGADDRRDKASRAKEGA